MIKVWIVYVILIIVMGIVEINIEPRLATPMLPLIAPCVLLGLYAGLIWFHPGFDYYGNRIGLFWAWLNIHVLGNIFMLH